MTTPTTPFARTPAATLLVLAPLTLLIGYAALTITFDYPAVLRHDPGDILTAFRAGGPALVAQWYLMALASVLFIPAGLLLHPLLARRDAALAPLATGLVTVGGLVNALGFLRWPFLVPTLAARYAQGSDAERDTVAVVFGAFHTYAGMAVGEHLGFLFLGGWLALTGPLLRRAGVVNAPLSGLWIVSGVGTVVGVLEPLGVPAAGLVNALAATLGMIAVLLTGASLLRTSVQAPRRAEA